MPGGGRYGRMDMAEWSGGEWVKGMNNTNGYNICFIQIMRGKIILYSKVFFRFPRPT